VSEPRIFVNIAAYRDTECQWTVKDLFEKARAPERIFVGLCWQFVPEEDQDCFLVPSPRPEQTRIVEFDAKGKVAHQLKNIPWLVTSVSLMR